MKVKLSILLLLQETVRTFAADIPLCVANTNPRATAELCMGLSCLADTNQCTPCTQDGCMNGVYSIQFDETEAWTMKSISITSSTKDAEFDPDEVIISGSNDAGDTWKKVATKALSWTERSYLNTITFDNNKKYLSYQIKLRKSSGTRTMYIEKLLIPPTYIPCKGKVIDNEGNEYINIVPNRYNGNKYIFRVIHDNYWKMVAVDRFGAVVTERYMASSLTFNNANWDTAIDIGANSNYKVEAIEFCDTTKPVEVLSTLHPKQGDYGKYFRHAKDVWSAQIGSYGSSWNVNVAQARNGAYIWAEKVQVLTSTGRRYSGAADGQWQTGDKIIRAITVKDLSHPNTSGGTYFYCDKDIWVSQLGGFGKKVAMQWRNGVNIWTGEVMTWDNMNLDTKYRLPTNNHGVVGRRYSGAADGQWQVGDIITTAAIRVTSLNNRGGKYFYFDKVIWISQFGGLGIKDAMQWRNGVNIWTGTVVTWDNHNGVHGRRYSGAANGQWQVGDIITTTDSPTDLL